MADITIAGLTARTSLAADDQFEVDNGVTTDDSERASFSLMGGLEIVHRDTDAVHTMVVGEHYVCDISAWSNSGAGRVWTLPASAQVGERIAITLEVGDATEHLAITAATSDTLNGVAGGTEWSRLFITGETVVMKCVTADSIWIVEHDGRIPCKARMHLASTASSHWAGIGYLKMVYDTEDYDVGDIASITTEEITPRRAGYYVLHGRYHIDAVLNEDTMVAKIVTGTPTDIARGTQTKIGLAADVGGEVTTLVDVAIADIGAAAGQFEVQGFNGAATPEDALGGSSLNFFEVWEVL